MKIAGFVGPSAPSQSPVADCERTVNYYVEPLPQNARNRGALYPSPGFSTLATVSQVGGRALYEMNDLCFGVWGSQAYSVPSTLVPTSIGTMTQDQYQAQIVSNGAVGAQFLFASGGNGYCYTPATSAFTQVLTGDCRMIGMLDGYGIALDPSTSKFRLSNLNDFTTWDPNQFAQRGDAPDSWVAMVVNIPDIWLIGEQTGVVWYDAGAFPFPFAQRPGATFKYGIGAPWTLKTAAGYVLWLSHNDIGAGIVVMAVGYTPQRISTYEVEAAIATYQRTSTIADAEAVMFQYYGHVFYAITFPSAGATWVYDVTTGLWTEWGKWNSPMTQYDIWQPRVHCHAFGQHLVGDRTTGHLSAMDGSFPTEGDGTVIRRQRRFLGPFTENRQFPHRRLEIFMETGVGTISGAGIDPKATLRTSDDGGRTWLPERTASVGKIGEYPVRVLFNRLGVPRNRVYDFVVSDPVPYRLVDAYLNNDEPIGRQGNQ